jgi:hypothetical protein
MIGRLVATPLMVTSPAGFNVGPCVRLPMDGVADLRVA